MFDDEAKDHEANEGEGPDKKTAQPFISSVTLFHEIQRMEAIDPENISEYAKLRPQGEDVEEAEGLNCSEVGLCVYTKKT